MARFYPANENDFSRISGVGEKKLREFGDVFLREIAAHLQTNPRQIFADDSFSANAAAPTPRRSRLTDTVRETLHFFRQGKTVPEIARIRGVKDGTIYSHLEEAMLAGEAIDVNALVSAEAQREIAAAFARNMASEVSVLSWNRSAANTATANAASSAPPCRRSKGNRWNADFGRNSALPDGDLDQGGVQRLFPLPKSTRFFHEQTITSPHGFD